MAKELNVSLDAVLSSVAGYVTVAGVKHAVRPISAPGMQLVQRMGNPDAEQPDASEVVAECRSLCPSLGDAFWDARPPLAVTGVILGVAQHIVGQVEAALPNSSGPTTTSQSPASESPAP